MYLNGNDTTTPGTWLAEEHDDRRAVKVRIRRSGHTNNRTTDRIVLFKKRGRRTGPPPAAVAVPA